ncbi:hypothetical protein ACLMAL_11465, partial [Nocardia sp. CWNU-33]
MTLEMPAVFPDWLVESCAGHFPECDEDAMLRLSRAYDDAAETCNALARQHTKATKDEQACIDGITGEVKGDRGWQLDGDLYSQRDYCRNLAAQCRQKAYDAEFQKLLVISTGLTLLAQLTVDFMLAGPGLLAAAEQKAGADATIRAGSKTFFSRVKAAGEAAMVTRKGIPLAKVSAAGAVFGAGAAATSNFGAQAWQKYVLHHREEIKVDMVRDAAIIGGVAGFVGVRVSSRFAPKINQFFDTIGKNTASTALRFGNHVARGLLIGGVGGLAGGVAGALTQIPVTGHTPTGAEFKQAMIMGFAGGFVGSAVVFVRPMPPRAQGAPAAPAAPAAPGAPGA